CAAAAPHAPPALFLPLPEQTAPRRGSGRPSPRRPPRGRQAPPYPPGLRDAARAADRPVARRRGRRPFVAVGGGARGGPGARRRRQRAPGARARGGSRGARGGGAPPAVVGEDAHRPRRRRRRPRRAPRRRAVRPARDGVGAAAACLVVLLGVALVGRLGTEWGRQRIQGLVVVEIQNLLAEGATVEVDRLEGNFLTGARLTGLVIRQDGELTATIDTVLVE